MNWDQFEKGIFLVNLLGIIYNPQTKRILIGKRENDLYLQNLSWVFPGGRANYKDELESSLDKEIIAKTGLNVDIKMAVFAKTYPEKREFLSIYYYCETTSIDEFKAGGSITELKWVKPSEVQNYFTTSLHPTLLKYLQTLE